MKSAVIVFPGSNCDRDLATAFEAVSGSKPEMVWHRETELPEGLDLIGVPGGFSYGDYLRSGAMAARSPVMQAVAQAAAGMSWAEFSNLAAAGFRNDGCEVQHLAAPGADFALQKDGHEAIVSARRWKAARIGVEPLRELQAVREQRGAREAVFIVLGEVSDNAWQYARTQNVSLMTAPDLARLLRTQKF